jgi:sugar/nucleoside kinase (ribokinase family)
LVFLDTKKHLGDWSEGYSFIKINHKEYEETKHTLDDQITAKLIITRGPHGCEYRGLGHPVPSVEVKDTSGAGDTFLAALAKTYVETRDISAAIEFANECATTVVQRRGVSVV